MRKAALGSLLVGVLLWGSGPAGAGIVPDGSVVKSEASAPSLPVPGQRPKAAHPGSESGRTTPPRVATPEARRAAGSDSAAVGPSGGASEGASGNPSGHDISVTDPAEGGGAAASTPLTPVEPPSAARSVLWVVLAGFVLLALLSAWRSRQLPPEFEE